MLRRFCLTIDGGEESQRRLEGTLSEEESAVLECYIGQVEQLTAIGGVREGLPCRFSFSFDIQQLGGSIEADLPDNDTLAAVLHRLRPLILQRESASFVNTCAVLGKRLSDAGVHAILREKRDLFENSDRAQTWAVSANNIRLNAESVLQDWLNGVEYHTDEDRRARIEKLLNGAEVLVRYSLVSMMLNKIDAIRAIDALVRVALDNGSAVRFARSSSDQAGGTTICPCPPSG